MSGRTFVVVLLIASAAVLGSIYTSGALIGLNDVIGPRDYLAKLNDNDTYGCKNSIRINPDVIVFGDSHAYAALDFNILAEVLQTQRIAACTLGSTFIETLVFALKHYEALGELPKTVIYCASTRGFWEEHNKKEMLFSQKTQISAVSGDDLLFSVQNLFEFLVRSDTNFYEETRARLRRNAPLVEAMDEAVIASVLARSETTGKTLSSWKKRIAEAAFTPESEALIREVCDIVERNHVELFIVAVPESPWLEKQYPDWIRERYHHYLNLFAPYAAGVFIYKTEDIGLGNRHYLNRSLRDGYDYAKWRSKDWVVRNGKDFDPDHMGKVGAIRFTRRAAHDMAAAWRQRP